MENLSKLIAEVQGAEGAMRLEDIVLLSKVQANVPVLFAHPGLVDMCIQQMQRELRRMPALYLVLSLASAAELQRQVFQYPGLLPAILGCSARMDEENEDVQCTAMLILLVLMGNLENARDSVSNHEDGVLDCMMDIVQRSYRHKVQAFAFAVIKRCVTFEEGEEEDTLLAFLHHAGMMEFLLTTPHMQYKMHVVMQLSTNSSQVAKEMFDYPGMLVLLIDSIRFEDDLEIRMDALRSLRALVEACPLRALDVAGLIPLFLKIGVDGEAMSRGALAALLKWHRALGKHERKLKRSEIVAFWQNVPVMWALLGNARVKKRSSLRRLPFELHRLVGEMIL